MIGAIVSNHVWLYRSVTLLIISGIIKPDKIPRLDRRAKGGLGHLASDGARPYPKGIKPSERHPA